MADEKDPKNRKELALGFAMRNLNLLSLGSPRKPLTIPPTHDPVFTYILPPLDEFLLTEAGEKSFRRVLEVQHATDNLDCYQAIKKFQADPTQENKDIVWKNFVSDKALRQVNLTAKVYTEISTQIAQGVLTKQMFDTVLDALRHIMVHNWYNGFRTTPAFDGWLVTQGTSAERLRDEWWEKNKNTKWSQVGKRALQSPFAKYIEEEGNACGVSEQRNKYQPQDLIGKLVKVYWPADNLTRTCQIQKYNSKTGLFVTRYYFNHKKYDEDLQTDWCFFLSSNEFIHELKEAGFFMLHDGVKYLY